MRELRRLVEAARQLRASGEPFLVSTVVAVRGSAYRGPGARMLSTAERWVAGSVSGGCLERDVLRKGFWQTRETRALLVTHDESSEERGGNGCQGQIDLLIERAPSPEADCDPLVLAERCWREETSAAVATVIRSRRQYLKPGDRLALLDDARVVGFTDPELEHELLPALRAARELPHASADVARPFVSADGAVEALVERIAAPPHLFVFGAAHDSAALAALAEPLGFSVSVWSEHQLDPSARERFSTQPRLLLGSLTDAVSLLDRSVCPLAVVMGHHYERDRAAIQALANSRARFIGVLGPLSRTERMLADLVDSGKLSSPTARALLDTRLHAPAGLDLGSRTPAEVALSILAEIQAVLHGASARALRQKQRAIHG